MGDAGLTDAQGQPYVFRPTPHLKPTIASQQLIVHGKPFLILGAELHNSSLSSAKYMREAMPNLTAMHINTLLGSVTWEMIEPEEGRFDFKEFDEVLKVFRAFNMKLVILWFGSWKNARSTYVPAWVKRDAKRFPRVKVKDDHTGKLQSVELLSPWCEAAKEADARAFGKLMAHLKEVDEKDNTVIMVQVENETGLLGDSRCRSKLADAKFKEDVPKDILQYLIKCKGLHPMFAKRWPDFSNRAIRGGSWEDVFGEGVAAEEIFMADAFARYVGQVAKAGKHEYDIPFYANVWLNFDDPSVLDLSGIPLGEGTPTVAGGGAKAGIYPSGGPVPHTLDVWRCHTIEDGYLNFLGPDLYLHDYEWTCKQYTWHQGQPLFIPEQKADDKGARRVWLAYGSYASIGCSPFGIDSIAAEQCAFSRTYELLNNVSDLILDVQAHRPSDMFGFFFDEIEENEGKQQWRKTFGNFEVVIDRSFVFGKPDPGYGIVIHQGDGKFLLIGAGFQTTFKSTMLGSTFTGIASSKEVYRDEKGEFQTLRTMNGDETRSGEFMIMPNEDPDYGGFPIRVTIPARTYMAEVEAYSIEEHD